MTSTELALGRARRSYSRNLKQSVVAECGEAGKSVAGVALKHGINANIVHKWIRQHKAHEPAAVPAFLPLPLHNATVSTGSTVRVQIQRGGTVVTVEWPIQDSQGCALWLSQWLR